MHTKGCSNCDTYSSSQNMRIPFYNVHHTHTHIHIHTALYIGVIVGAALLASLVVLVAVIVLCVKRHKIKEMPHDVLEHITLSQR